ncbi:L-tyrosine/L-tryptophan isonitrile synthase family protein [Thalassomonas viridans]|uniref:L-tyrosine/L-tryptophan isonitrile synthase family protein n=1 Tax=Thalassomonas viridans TaxID=137584 RepID=A0AAF0C9M9_9GAMM|nr:isocyanide synthase family protein [Thalassomonas viridans]WDE05953.1 L-tyrosine/L-tryptophan isonitrile synthase family protein [Thalassomonas viridans]
MKPIDEDIAVKILEIIFKRRKLVEAELSSPESLVLSALSPAEVEQHLDKVRLMVAQQQAIRMVLPAYPGKSPNRDKTLSKLPDLAEKHSIDNLYRLCREIEQIYPPGAKIVICSDGYVFSDLVRIPDPDVELYTREIIRYYQRHYPGYFEFFDIKDAFPELSCLDAMREELMVCYGESLIRLSARCKSEKESLSMYRGITRFLSEDFAGLAEFSRHSKNQIQKQAKSISIRVIQRSNAWGELLAELFPNALRLSIHPQYRVSAKIGISMADADDGWRTPWHSVAVMKNRQIHLLKRSQIDENHHRLIFNGGKPCHYRELAQGAGEAHYG